jgi:hypothetical protein
MQVNSYEKSFTDDEDGKKVEIKKERSVGSTNVPAIKTYSVNATDFIKSEGITRTDIVAAESARREEMGLRRTVAAEEHSPAPLGKIIFGLMLLLAFAVGIGLYALIGMGERTDGDTTLGVTSASSLSISLGGPRAELIADLSIAFGRTGLAKDGYREIVFVTEDPVSGKRTASTAEFLRAATATTPPDGFLRSLEGDARYVVYSANELSGALIIKTRSYQNTFAETLQWESRMNTDLVPVLHPTLGESAAEPLSGAKFKDIRVGNTDVRVLADRTERPYIAYAFIDKKTLVIAGSTELLRVIAEGKIPLAD